MQIKEVGQALVLTPVILDTNEAEIRRIVIGSQPGHIVHKTLSQKKLNIRQGWWRGSRKAPT
jgi:hypothetical protein